MHLPTVAHMDTLPSCHHPCWVGQWLPLPSPHGHTMPHRHQPGLRAHQGSLSGGVALWVQIFPSPLPSHLHLQALPHSLPVPASPGTPIWPCLSPHRFLDASMSSTSGPGKNQFQQSLCVSRRTGKCFQNDSFDSHDSRCLMLCALRVSLTKYRSLTSPSHSASCPYSVTSPSGYR